MKRLTSLFAATALCVALSSPALAFGDEPGDDHGPAPLGIVHAIIGTTFWVVSVPFTALVAPLHVMDSFEQLVIEPFEMTIGTYRADADDD